MSTNRAALLTKAHRVLKKHYKPVAPPSDRTLLEHYLFSCCLEGAKHEQAEEAFALLQQKYFDWNEVRVTTPSELAHVVSALPSAQRDAARLKRSLHSLFEAHYTFDVEFLKKENIGKAVKEIEKLKGVTPFTVNYVVQNALGGHAIPVNNSGLDVMYVLGVISENERNKKRVPGLERAISKNKGVEFGSLLHQISVEYGQTPFSNRVRAILLEIADDAKERFPKRASKAEKDAKESKKSSGGKKVTAAGKAKPAGKKAAAAKTEKKSAKKKTPVKKTPAKKAAKKPVAKKAPKKTPTKKTKSPTSRLSKKKPR
ncbi:MAG: hypothetical protein QGG36_17835 [Pirellulaceae bacterium]|jgi:endonuclease-3|nr:hypothetical protein [Pirellulaceae bacterium]MDP7017670.1 hypothetical protein [Pirellulaceae bacterium]